VTEAESSNCPEHDGGQSIPAGELVTVPEPITSTVRVCSGAGSNVAVTV
jgi:hypothetical protein